MLSAYSSHPVADPTAFFTIYTEHFGYPMWAANVPGSPAVDSTDQPHEIAYFECALNDGARMARELGRYWGFEWRVVNAGSAEHQANIAAHHAYAAQQAAYRDAFTASQRTVARLPEGVNVKA